MSTAGFRPSRARGNGDLFVPLVIDSFAGGGGASLGIERALRRPVDIAINHDPAAIELHRVNHPNTRHLCEDVWSVDPVEATGGRPVRLAWFSPDCTHHSKAKGGKPRSQRIRGLAWVVLRWAARVRPDVIMLENVEEFAQWGPLTRSRRPCPRRRGSTFHGWKQQLIDLGYLVEHRELRACDYGTPTIRRRLFVIARRDGEQIVWPDATHGVGTRRPYRTAAECIDWSLPCPSIFERRRPLAPNTLRRIARGIQRYVIDAKRPFIVATTHHGSDRLYDGGAPMPTITAAHRGELALVAAFLARHGRHENDGAPLDAPLPTITTIDHHALVAVQAVPAQTTAGRGNHVGEVRAFLVAYYGTERDGARLEDPMRTLTTRDRLGLVTVRGETYAIADIGMGMLAPRELYRAQGFPDDYVIDRDAVGRAFTKTLQVRMVGNSVCPQVAEQLVRANVGEHVRGSAAA